MNFEDALEDELKSIAALQNRVYPLANATKQNGTPYVIYVSSEGLRTKTLDGYQIGKQVAGEINVVSSRYGEMKSVTNAVIELLVSVQQRTIGTDGPFIQEISYEQPREFYEENAKLHRCLIDFEVYF